MSVPKIIHQLWIGEKNAPMNAMNSVKNMNPDYEYMFWNEKTIENNLIINKRYKRKLEDHNAIWGQADMYRYIILEKYGGIFVDADMVCVEPFDAFFCWENETARPNLCATSLQGYTPNHIIPQTAIKWIMDNNVNIEQTKIQSWELVGPGLLSIVYHRLISDKSVVNVLPSYTALPDHHTGSKYKGHGKVYMSHEWGSTKNNYEEINNMKIPIHHTKPKSIIDIYIPNDIKTKQLKEVLQGIKNMVGHFIIKISYEGDLNKYIKSMRFVEHKKYEMTNDGLVGSTIEDLTTIMCNEGSDKGQGRHNYTEIYEELFDPIRYKIKSFCEIGLGTTNPNIKSNMGQNGIPLASVRGWKKYFSNAVIYGGDIDSEILINEDRLYTYIIDMTNKESIDNFWNNFNFKHDIIMDDGLHEFEANVLLFENSFNKFNEYYIIEDIAKIYLDKWNDKIEEWIKEYTHLEFKLIINPMKFNDYDNNLIVISKKI